MLDSAGNATSSQLYTPYGVARYNSGSSPTTLGYTGQRADSVTGLDYYHARYYDPVAGQFTSADTANDGTNRYGYVHGNPTTATDPSGHYQCFDDPCTRGGGGGSTPPPPPPPPTDCQTTNSCTSTTGGGGSGGGIKPDPKECGTYTQAQCDQASAAQLAAVRNARRQAGIWQLLVGLGGIVVDFIELGLDFGEISLNTVIDIGTDIAGIIADLGVTFEAEGNLLASIFSDNDFFSRLRQIGQTFATVGLHMKAGLAAIKANTGFWVNVAKAALLATMVAASAEFTGTLAGTEELIDAVGDMALQAIRSLKNTSIRTLLSGGLLTYLQAQAADQSTSADIMAGETPFGFCTSDAATPACPK